MPLAVHKRTKHSTVWSEPIPSGGRRGFCRTSQRPQHFESVLDSGDFDTACNCTSSRVTSAQIDGYRMVNNGFHFAIQTVAPTASTVQPNSQPPAGTVGFGGRKGQHWFKFRLRNVGYIHGPTRDVDDIGGAPDYSAPPTLSHRAENYAPHANVADDMRVRNSRLEWGNIWNTPGGGELSITWNIDSAKLKEDIVINQAARDWITANRPWNGNNPTWQANQTWFGFRFQIDASDIPKAVLSNIVRDFDNDDFSDDDGPLELRTVADELLAFMPLEYVVVKGQGGRRPLRKRFYKSGGQVWLFVGVKVSDLAGLLPGDLVFDPQMTQEAVAAESDDGREYSYNSGSTWNWWTSPSVGYAGEQESSWWNVGARFTPPLPNGADTTTGSNYATLKMQATGYGYGHQGDPNLIIIGDTASEATFDTGNPTQNGANQPSGFTDTTATVAVNPTDPGDDTDYNFDCSAIVEELIAQGSWASSDGLRLGVMNDAGNNVNGDSINVQLFAGSEPEPRLDVYYTTASAANPKGPLGHPLHGPFGGPIN